MTIRTLLRQTVVHRLASSALVLLLGLGPTGCGGEEPDERGVIRRVAALLARVPRESIVRLSATDTLHISEGTIRFYRWRLYRSAWTDGVSILPQGQQLYTAIGSAGDDGLDPRSYGWDLARAMVARLDSALNPQQRAALLGELDLVLSEGFTRYAGDLIQGTIDPNEGGLDWRIHRDTTLTEDVLKATRSEPIDQIIAGLRPEAPYYARLVEALARYRQLEEHGGWPEVPAPPRPVRPGQPGGATVTALRQRLLVREDTTESRLARWGEGNPALFDDSLRVALTHFQRRNAIDEDGALGSNTLRELNHSVQDRIADLRLNLDRWRWLPRHLGARYIVVNVAGYELEIIEEGRPVLFMNVVVGKEGLNTPIFADTMEYLVVNPSWNVPPSIAKGEILPALRRDPGYLAARHFDVLRGEQIVDPASVDFSNPDAYRFRQRPGADNALGQIKFMLPNADNIYLHDTPATRFFSLSDRAFSHGCIRLEHPEELARLLMDRVTDTPPEALDALIAARAEKTIRFREGVPVYILYFTAWVDEDGTVRFPHDVYGRDTGLEPERQRKLEHPTAAGQTAS